MRPMKYVLALAILCLPAVLAAKGACIMADAARKDPDAALSLTVGWQTSPLLSEHVLALFPASRSGLSLPLLRRSLRGPCVD